MKNNKFDENAYREDVKEYKKILYSTTEMANQSVNFFMMMAFHEIGEDIQKKGMFLEEYVERISTEFSDRRFTMSKQNIRYMCKFSLLVKVEEIATLRLFEYEWTELIPYIKNSNNHDEFVTYIEEEKKAGEA